jgi:hypothetical protein
MSIKQLIREWLNIRTTDENDRVIADQCRAAMRAYARSYEGDRAMRDYTGNAVKALSREDINTFVQTQLRSEQILDDIVARLKKKQLK